MEWKKVLDRQELTSFITELDWKYIKQNFFTFIILYGLAMLSIFRANVNYIDDLGRSADGYRGWDNFSRWISQYGSVLVHGKTHLTDMSPMPQLLAIVGIAIASTIVLYVFVDRKKYSLVNVMAVLPLGISPYFLECLSYKYDSPYMALSVLSAIFPFLFLEHSKKWFCIASFTGLLIMCMTYQASSGIYILMLIFYCFKIFVRDEYCDYHKLVSIIFLGIICFGISLGVYKLFFVKAANTYVSSELAKNGLLTTAYNNANTYIKLILSDIPVGWRNLCVGVLSLFMVNVIVKTKRNKCLVLFITLITLGLGLVLSYGAYLVLQKPLFATRAMYGIGAFVAIISVVGLTVWNKNVIFKALCCYLSWCLFGYAFLYGNALAEQKRYAEFRIQMVINDLNALPMTKKSGSEKVILTGSTLNSPLVERWSNLYPVLRRETPSLFSGSNWIWHSAYFFNYYDLKHMEKLNIGKEKISKEELNHMPVIYNKRYHEILSDGRYILVKLK